MPTKKRTASSQKKEAVKKNVAAKAKAPSAAKKSAAKKAVLKKAEAKKPVAKKTAPAKKPVAKIITKKETVKPAVAKKIIAKAREEVKQAVEEAPVVTITETQIMQTNKPVEVYRKVVFVGHCTNCEHLPVRVSKLLAVFCILIAVLSGIIISKIPFDFTPYVAVHDYFVNVMTSLSLL